MSDLDKATRCYVATTDILQAVLGLIHSGIGVAALLRHMQYLDIVDNHADFVLVMIFHIVLGIFAFIFSVLKAGVSFCATKSLCTFVWLILATTGLFGVMILTLSLAITTSLKNTEFNAFEEMYMESSTNTFLDYSNTQTQWDLFQINFQCCGVSSASDYIQIFNTSNTVPESCCNHVVLDQEGLNCSDVAANVSLEHLVMSRVFNQGCANSVISEMTYNYVLISGASFALSIILLEGIILAIYIIYRVWNTDDNKVHTFSH